MVQTDRILNSSRGRHSELAKAQSELQELETRLVYIRSLIDERKAERLELEARPQMLTATGDINELMALKSRSIALDKAISEMSLSEQECVKRIESARRYLYSLYVRLESLRKEASDLAAKISSGHLPDGDSHRARLRRVEIQIEAITGAE